MPSLPVLGFWGLARRLVRSRTRGGAALEDMLYFHPLGNEWIETAVRTRVADPAHYAAALTGSEIDA